MDQKASPESDRRRIRQRQLTSIVAVALVFGVVGVAIGAIRSGDYSATASVTLDAATPHVFDDTALGSDQGDLTEYVESQTGVFDSIAVARRAGSRLEGGPYTPLPEEVQDATEATAASDSPEIEVTYTAEEEGDAIAGANAVVEGYQQLRQQRWAESHSSAIAAVEQTLESAMAETQRLTENMQSGSQGETDVSQEMLSIIEELRAIDESVQGGVTAESLEAADVRRQLLANEIAAIENVMADQMEGGRQSTASARLEAALAREAGLRERLIQLQVDSQLDGDGIAFAAPAVAAAPASAGPLLAGVAGVIFGVFVGLAVVYWQRGRLEKARVSTTWGRVGPPATSTVETQAGRTQDVAATAPLGDRPGGRHR